MMSRRRCCCGTGTGTAGCVVFSDSFDGYTLTLQPGPSDGIDTDVYEGSPDSNLTIETTFSIIGFAGVRRNGLLKFDLSSIPAGTITAATLYLYGSGSGISGSFYVNRILSANSAWTDGGATWNYALASSTRWAGDSGSDGGTDAGCSVSGTDYSSTLLGSMTYTSTLGTENSASLDLTEFAAMVASNQGMVIRDQTAGAVSKQPVSSDHPTYTNYRPKLTIDLNGGGDVPNPADWSVVSGTWAGNGDKLTTSGTDPLLECLHTVPSDVGTGTANPDHYLVYVSVGFDTDRDRAIVKVDDQAVYVELERYAATKGQLRIFENGVCKGSRNVPIYPSTPITVCVDGDMVHVSLGAAELLSIPHTTVSGIVHLAAVATGTVTFDDFVLSEHYYDDANCPDCRNEDCEWFYDSGFVGGELSDTDYSHTLGTGTGTAEGGWDYYNNALRATQDARLQVAVSPSHGITGVVDFDFDLSNANDGCYLDFSYDGGSCFVRVTKESTTSYVAEWWCGDEQIGLEDAVSIMGVRLCWDGVKAVGETAGVSYHLSDPTAFSPTVEVGNLTSGHALVTQIVATKTGSLIVPERACPDCEDQDCGCVPFYHTATLTLSGISLRDPWPTGYPEPPYGMECPDTVVFHLTATAVQGEYGAAVKCMWAGYTDYEIPHCCYDGVTATWSLVRLYAEVTVTNVTGGIGLAAKIGTVSESAANPEPGQAATSSCAYGAVFECDFEETILGEHVSCDSVPDMALAVAGCHQFDVRNPFMMNIFAFLSCRFCTCVSLSTGYGTETCADFTTPLTLDFASPDPDA